MVTKQHSDQQNEQGAPNPLGERAPNAVTRPARRGDESNKPVVGMPEGYKPDTSVKYVKGKEGQPDQIHNEDGSKTDVSPHNSQTPGNQLETLPKDHTYRDRVEAQARSLGIPVNENETLEFLMWKISMAGSS